MNKDIITNWRAAIHETYDLLLSDFLSQLPQILGALVLLLIGWGIANLLRILTRRVVMGIQTMMSSMFSKRNADLEMQAHTMRQYSKWGGTTIYWITLLFFISASANLLDWKIFSGLSRTLLQYVPSLLSGVIIILGGFILSGVARTAVQSAAVSIGFERSQLVGVIAQVTVSITAIVIGVEKLGINVEFITTSLIVVAGVSLAGAALAFGLGSKDYIANVLSAKEARRSYSVGQHLKLRDMEGELLEITQTSIILDTEQGRTTVPASILQKEPCELIVEIDNDSGSVLGHLFSKNKDTDKRD